MNADLLLLISGAVLSAIFSFVPGAKEWFEKFNTTQKRGIMAILLFVVTAGVFGLECAGYLNVVWPGSGVTCSDEGAVNLIYTFALALGSNQGTYWITEEVRKRT